MFNFRLIPLDRITCVLQRSCATLKALHADFQSCCLLYLQLAKYVIIFLLLIVVSGFVDFYQSTAKYYLYVSLYEEQYCNITHSVRARHCPYTLIPYAANISAGAYVNVCCYFLFWFIWGFFHMLSSCISMFTSQYKSTVRCV